MKLYTRFGPNYGDFNPWGHKESDMTEGLD